MAVFAQTWSLQDVPQIQIQKYPHMIAAGGPHSRKQKPLLEIGRKRWNFLGFFQFARLVLQLLVWRLSGKSAERRK